MFTKTIENTSPKRQRVNESQNVHSLALRACKGAENGAVQLRNDPGITSGSFRALKSQPETSRRVDLIITRCVNEGLLLKQRGNLYPSLTFSGCENPLNQQAVTCRVTITPCVFVLLISPIVE